MTLRLFRRRPARILNAFARPWVFVATVSALRKFRRPFSVLRAYIGRTCPFASLQMRNGLTIHLSGDPDDVTTILVVLGRRDYGEVPEDGTVIDVGGHLGAFSLYAAQQGARAVYVYEPDATLFEVLGRNVIANHFEGRIHVCHAAVIGHKHSEVTFYPEGNASGHIERRETDLAAGVTVRATTIENIVIEHALERIDLLKLDCEGSEYEIVLNTPQHIWDRIDRIRLEYHHGNRAILVNRLAEAGFRLISSRKATGDVGMLFLDRVGVRTRAAAD